MPSRRINSRNRAAWVMGFLRALGLSLIYSSAARLDMPPRIVSPSPPARSPQVAGRGSPDDALQNPRPACGERVTEGESPRAGEGPAGPSALLSACAPSICRERNAVRELRHEPG